MGATPKIGPITIDELEATWQSSTDTLYSQPILDETDGDSLTLYRQEFAQLERVSQAIDRTSQAMYILPWSGQSDVPAGGEAFAEVDLTFQRTKLNQWPLVISSVVMIEEATQDMSPDGAIHVLTGRRYSLIQPLVFNPGEQGPFTVKARAIMPGYGYNNPEPGSITSIFQPGVNLSNDKAKITKNSLLADNRPDTPIPGHVGQYVFFPTGANAGEIRRVYSYGAPDPANNVGGVFVLERMAVMEVDITAGPGFISGEIVTLIQAGSPPITLATGKAVKQTGSDPYTNVSWVLSGPSLGMAYGAGITLNGADSGTVANVTSVPIQPDLTDDTGATWQMLDWINDWGLTVTNPQSPTGGRLGMLDALGDERKIKRSPEEEDDDYRLRVSQIADVVSPNAVKRAGNRVLNKYGLTICLREVGLSLLPGFFFDLDAFDYDFSVFPGNRFRLWLDYTDFRAFFLVGVPSLNWGEFGFAYDGGPNDAFDANVYYDGFPKDAAAVYKDIWQAIDETKAGGVGFELYVESLGCF